MAIIKKSGIKLNPKQRKLVSERLRYVRKKYREENNKLRPVYELKDAMRVYFRYLYGRLWHSDKKFMKLLREAGPIEFKS